MKSNSPPSLDPANKNSLAGTLKHVLWKYKQRTDGCLPAKVIQYDRSQNRVQVQPLIKMVLTDGSQESRAQIASVPVLQLGAGGFYLTFNLKPNDLGWIVANDRDISIFLQNLQESPPNTQRIKDFSDAIFIPDGMDIIAQSSDDENFVIQNRDGSVKISWGIDRITEQASFFIINATGTDPFPIRISGNIYVTGNIGASGTVSGSVPPPPPLPPPP